MTAETFISNINRAIVNPLILLLIALAMVYFLWGLAMFVANSAGSDGRAEGKRKIIWGLVGLFIMVSVFGILRILLNTFGISAPPGLG